MPSPFDRLKCRYTLTPAGVEGDEVIQRLADRLVALDLLGRAAELPDHQLKYRLRGVEMARVGTRLAVLHLMNGTPEGAIRATTFLG